MKLTKLFLTILFVAFIADAFAQRGLQSFTDHKTGKAISYNRDNIVRAYPTTSGTKLWFNLGNPTDVDDAFDDICIQNPGLIPFTYVNKTNSLKSIAINPDYIVKAYPTADSSQSVFVMKDGNVFLIDTDYVSAAAIVTRTIAKQQSISYFYDTGDTFYYAIPAGAKTLTIIGVGAGGGGGSGRRGAAGTARGGGSGGGSGAVSTVTLDVDDLFYNDSLDIILGAPGQGGAAVTANTTDGNVGTAGGATKVFVTGQSYQLLLASGGSGGLGGSTASVAGGAGGTIGDYPGYAGGAGDTTGVAGTSSTKISAGGGGGGGGIGVTNVNRSGGDGGAGQYGLNGGGTGGAGGAQGTAIQAYVSIPVFCSGGGSGAGGGGFAGRASVYGAGGGGGSGSLNGTNSGAGGAGGQGVVRIIANF